MPERCLVIGLGQVGMGYDLELDPSAAVHSHARAFSQHPAFELSGGVDASEARCSLFVSHYNSSAFCDLHEALDVINPVVVVIATPTETHSRVLHQVLAHSKPKLILCEKPLAYDLVAASNMLSACKGAGVDIYVNYIRRADPGVLEVKARIDSSAIKLPVKGNVWYSKGFLNNGSHFFNLLEFWLGQFVRATVLETGRLWDAWDPEPCVQVEFENGKVIFQSGWGENFSHNTLELLSPSGRLRYEEGGSSISWQSLQKHPTFAGYKILVPEPESIINDMKCYQWNVVDQIACALNGEKHNLCDGREALRTLEAMHKIIDQK